MSTDQLIERRTVAAAGELVVSDTGTPEGKRTLRGYAALWNSPSLDLGGFKEIIKRGAFANSLKKDDQRALWNHESRFVLARRSASTLKLQEDDKGLAFTLSPPDAGWARDLLASISRRDVTQMSFAFTTNPGGDTWSRRGATAIRELLSVTLLEISVVSFPAYTDTTVYVRERIDPEILAELERRRVRLLKLLRGD